MQLYTIILKLIAPIFMAVGILHLGYGVGAEVMLGANLPAQALTDPVLDSQNRFYGVAFMLYGVLFFLCATDLERYKTVLRCVLLVFLAGGLARIVSMATHGLPSLLVLGLLASELLLPPALLVWLSKIENYAGKAPIPDTAENG